MDNEYLHSIDASPYVEEGFLSHARATGAGLRQRLQNITPSEDPYHTPFYAQLMSYYKGLIKDIKSTLSEFSVGASSPAERLKKMQLTPEEKTTIDSLSNLYDRLSPSMFPHGTNSEFKPKLMRGLTPSNISLSQAMQQNVKESWIGRKGAQSTGQASVIINKYVNELQSAYSKFIGNIQKLFPTSPKQILSREFKKNIGDPKISKGIDNIEGVINFLPNTQPKVEKDVAINPNATSSTPDGTNTIQPSRLHPPTKSAHDKDSLAEIVERVIEIIINAVSSDERSKDWMEKPLPTNWTQPPTTKDDPTQNNTQPTFTTPADSPSEDSTFIEEKLYDKLNNNQNNAPDEKEEVEYTGEFLYNFHSKMNKFPGGGFNIEVKPSNTSLSTIKLTNGSTKELVVVWAVKSKTENNIYVKHKTTVEQPSAPEISTSDYNIEEAEVSNQWDIALLFKFWDHQVNPRSSNNKFDVNSLIARAHPSKGNVLSGANSQILEKIDSLTEPLLRACYATTSRKHMEFSPKGLNIRMTDTGKIIHIKRDGYHEEISDDVISIHIKSKNINERKKWIEALEKIGWFKYKNIDVPDWKVEHPETSSLPLKNGDNPPTPAILANKIQDIPAAADAVKALIALSKGKGKEIGAKTAIDIIQPIVDKHGNSLSSEEYVKLALEKPKQKPIITPVSSPSIPPNPSGVGVTNSELKSTTKTELSNGNVEFNEDGKVVWTKPNGKIVKFTPNQINSIYSPMLMTALQKAKYPFDKFNVKIKENKFINPFQSSNFL